MLQKTYPKEPTFQLDNKTFTEMRIFHQHIEQCLKTGKNLVITSGQGELLRGKV
jgi:hypothetical protein